MLAFRASNDDNGDTFGKSITLTQGIASSSHVLSHIRKSKKIAKV
jgi:hypothetical protein